MFRSLPGKISRKNAAVTVGAFQFVSTDAITTSTTLVVTNLAIGYDYIITLEAFAPTSDGESLWMRFSDDAGVSYEAGASDYQWEVQIAASSIIDVSDSEIELVGTSTFGNDANNTNSMEITLPNPNAGSEQTTAFWRGFLLSTATTPDMNSVIGGGRFIQGVDAVDAVQFLWSSGSTFKAQGDITVWRRKRS